MNKIEILRFLSYLCVAGLFMHGRLPEQKETGNN